MSRITRSQLAAVAVVLLGDVMLVAAFVYAFGRVTQ